MDIKAPTNMKLEGNLAENWNKFKQKYFLYLEATEKMAKPDKLKVALLLTSMGEECIDIFNSFKLIAEDAENFNTVIKHFDEYFEPKKNTVIARYKFFNCKQQENESIDSFVTNLKNLAKECSFDTQEESLIRDLLIIGIRDLSVKEKLLIDSELNLTKAIEYCRAKESSDKQIKLMKEGNSKSDQIDYVKPKKIFKKYAINTKNKGECSKCRTKHEFGKCPAWGKKI